MKEGYFQKKLTELSEKQQELSSSFNLLQAEIDRIETRVGGLKPLIKRLNDVDSFKEQTLSEISSKNDDRMKRIQKEFADSLKKEVRDVTHKKADVLENSVKEIQKDKELFKRYTSSISAIESDIGYVKEFHRLLVMKLVNKGVLTYHEQEEINRRSLKKIKEK